MPDELTTLTERLVPLSTEGWPWQEDGRIQRLETQPLAETPWIYQNMTFQCVKWHQIFFEMISDRTMVHSHCHDCFKVVIMPRSLEELVLLENMQASSGLECKCGIELREFVKRKRLYGGYFYNRGVEQGRERFKFVRDWAQHVFETQGDNPLLDLTYPSPMPVILKRGCTEFEKAIGPSDQWEITDEQWALEEELDKKMDFEPFGEFPQHENLKEFVRVSWLRWAHHHGDMTYVKYTPEKKPLTAKQAYFTPAPVTYHEEE